MRKYSGVRTKIAAGLASRWQCWRRALKNFPRLITLRRLPRTDRVMLCAMSLFRPF